MTGVSEALTAPDALTALISRLRELMAKATPGDWEVEADMRSERVGDMYAADGYTDYLAGWNIHAKDGEVVGIEGILPDGEANAALIVEMRNSLPLLLDALSATDNRAPVEDASEAARHFRMAAQGMGRAGTADWPDGPYMSMSDAARLHEQLVRTASIPNQAGQG